MNVVGAPLYDLHCHLGFASNAAELASAVAGSGGGVLCATVEPDEYERLLRDLPSSEAVRLGVGLHPWWVADGRCGEAEVAACARLVQNAPFVAEVGLDFGKRRGTRRAEQLEAFRRVCGAAGRAGGKVISIHAVNAATETLDILEGTGCVGMRHVPGVDPCACILHWYSGPSDELQRAIGLGCFFSVGERMLSTRRGREYARAIPEDRIVLETDLPDEGCGSFRFEELATSLARARGQLEEIRGVSLDDALARTSRRLLNWRG